MIEKKILIIKTSALGDVLHVFPVLHYLRGKFPTAQIDWVAEVLCNDLLLAHPYINNYLAIDTKKWRKHPFSWTTWVEIKKFRRKLRATRYDYIFDFQGNVKSSWVLMQAKGGRKIGFGWHSLPEWPNGFFTHHKIDPPPGKNIREDYLSLVQHTFQEPQAFYDHSILLNLTQADKEKLGTLMPLTGTVVCVGAKWPNKQLPSKSLTRFLTVLGKYPYHFVWGDETEKQLCERLAGTITPSRVLPKCSLPLLQHVMAHTGLVISMDSLPLHLCGTTRTPTISFFGPSLADKYKPLGEQHVTYQGSCPYGVVFEKRCPKLRSCPTGLCMHHEEIHI